ncbi:hypothetical protein V1507DRAFT_247652 [Lipomyces tetrasporus]
MSPLTTGSGVAEHLPGDTSPAGLGERTPPGHDRTTDSSSISFDRQLPSLSQGVPLQRSCEQLSNVRSVYKCFCQLSELVHQSLYSLHSPGERDLLSIYTQYSAGTIEYQRCCGSATTITPAVLFAHMYYHFAILLLFRPLIKLRIVGSKVSPRDVCSQTADAIQGLLTSYTRLYTLQRTPGAFAPDFALTSSIMHLVVGAVSVQTGALESEQDTTVKIDRHVSDILRQGVAGHDRAHEIATEAIARHRHLGLPLRSEARDRQCFHLSPVPWPNPKASGSYSH